MYNEEDKKDNIDKVKESLYSKGTDAIFSRKAYTLKNKNNSDIKTDWNIEEKPMKKIKIPYTKILIGSFLFFILASGFTFFRFFFGQNLISGNNIDILVSGSVSIAGGEELPLNIEIKNSNNTALKSVTMRIEYPEGTKNPNDQTVDMSRYSESIGEIAVNKSVTKLIKAIIFGEENSNKTISIIVEYRVSGSNAVFSKKKDFNILIASSPVSMFVSGPTEINANQLTDFTIDVNSNSTTVIKNLILKVEYPFGFNLSSSDPKAYGSDSSVFSIGDLAPGAKRTIRITGSIIGQDGEQRVLKFIVGTKDQEDESLVKTTLASYMSSVSLKKSSIGLSMSINDEQADEVSAIPGGKNRVSISWSNNLAEKVYDMIIKVKFTGQTLDKSSVTADKGFYSSLDNLLTFDSNTNSVFSEVNPAAEGGMSFSFATLSQTSDSNIRFGNSSVKMEISVLGKLTSSSNGQEVLYSGSKIMKLSSNLKLLSRGFRTVGPFENTGPFPPQVDNETTYTITWTASNSFNDIASGRVSAFLPPNVKWTGYVNPDTETVTYDKNTGEVVWDIGSMRAGIGTSYPSRSVSFQVAITPSITQLGSEINLLNESTISGIDTYSNERVGEVKGAVTTNITSDPEYIDGIGKVIK
jgi:hypothetical protein